MPDGGEKPLAEQELLVALSFATLTPVYEGRERGSKTVPSMEEEVSIGGQGEHSLLTPFPEGRQIKQEKCG